MTRRCAASSAARPSPSWSGSWSCRSSSARCSCGSTSAPAEVFQQLADLADRLWALGFRSLRDLGDYIVAGAAIVVPVWLILRLLSYRGR